jgi:hypothetical protein
LYDLAAPSFFTFDSPTPSSLDRNSLSGLSALVASVPPLECFEWAAETMVARMSAMDASFMMNGWLDRLKEIE